MGFVIILAVAVIVLIVSIVFACNDDSLIWPVITGVVSASIVFFVLLIIIFKPISEEREFDVFVAQSEWINNHTAKDKIEDAALTQKKIELNTWLYEAQFCKKNYPLWTFLPDKVMDLEPIN